MGEALILSMQITEEHGSKSPVGPKPTLNTSSLPKIFITKILRAHRYQCIDCDADFKARVESEITRKLTRELRIELTEYQGKTRTRDDKKIR